MISALALSPSLDVTYVVAELAGIQRPLSTHRVAGGKALNAARAASALGARVSAVAVLGGGAGQDVAAGARADGVDLHVVPGEPTRSCVSIFAQDTGELTEIYERAVPVSVSAASAAVDAAVRLAGERPGWWLVSGGLPASAPAGLLADVVGRLREAGARVAVDSHGEALRVAVDARPDLVKVNRAEALELVSGAPGGDGPGAGDGAAPAGPDGASEGGTGEGEGGASEATAADIGTGAGHGRGAVPGGEQPDVPELLAAVRARTGGLVVITDGAAGAWATDGEEVLRATLTGHTGGFPVGSGDSFLGGLLVALDGGESLTDALALATAAGTANAQVPGAAVLDPTQTRHLSKKVEITSRG